MVSPYEQPGKLDLDICFSVVVHEEPDIQDILFIIFLSVGIVSGRQFAKSLDLCGLSVFCKAFLLQ